MSLKRVCGILADGSIMPMLQREDCLFAGFRSELQREAALEMMESGDMDSRGRGWRTCWVNLNQLEHEFPGIEIREISDRRSIGKFRAIMGSNILR